MSLVELQGEHETMKLSYTALEKSQCDMKLKLHALQDQLDDAEYTKKEMHKQLQQLKAAPPTPAAPPPSTPLRALGFF